LTAAHRKVFFFSAISSIAITAILACVATPKPQRIGDAPMPAKETADLNISKFHVDGINEIVQSDDWAEKKSVLVVLSEAATKSEAAKMTNEDYYTRLIRKTLLQQHVKLITGEVRARIEEYKEGDLQTRKETLQEAEKLILLGDQTGAEAILVFDQINALTKIFRDVYITEEDGSYKLSVQAIRSEKPADDPNVIRISLPAVIVRGRLVDTKSANIIAEFDICKFYYKNLDELQQMQKRIAITEFDPVSQTGSIMIKKGGCGGEPQYETYRYISRWNPKDVKRQSVVNLINRYIPTPEEIDAIETDAKLREILDSVVQKVL
jgi:hypothetical protein